MQENRSVKNSIFDGIKSVFGSSNKNHVSAQLVNSEREIYVEANRRQGKPLEVSLQWYMKNSGDQPWPKGTKLRMIKCYPPLNFSAKSKIPELQPNGSGVLLMSINIPEHFNQHFMILHFKL